MQGLSMRRIWILSGVLGSLALGATQAAHAQGFGDRLKRAAQEAAKRKAEQRVEQRAGEAADAAMNKAEGTVKCAASDDKCIEQAKKEGKQVDTSGGGAAAGGASAAAAGGEDEAAAGGKAAGKANVGKDFTPGTRVLFATDFKQDEIGDFPRKLELKSGNMEVADIGGTRYLRVTSSGSKVDIPLPETLPEMFTMEFDLKTVGGYRQYLYFTDEEDDRAYLSFSPWDAGIQGPKSYKVESQYTSKEPGKVIVPVQIMADGKYVKVYVNGTRVANAPNADIGRSKMIRFDLDGDNENAVLIGNIRIAAGGKDLYKALSESGRVTTEGIFFDTNSDRIRAESAPALKEIGDMMAKHSDLKILIEGHTDNVGNASTNMTLSEKRALAVKAYLVNNLSVDASRLTAKGFGSTKPVADNTSDDGRQKNRRVELVKQ
jgi:outer membrane protein OmpA-like peptidoglycan-associated protein